MLRFISDHKHHNVFVRDIHPHLVVEASDFIAGETEVKSIIIMELNERVKYFKLYFKLLKLF